MDLFSYKKEKFSIQEQSYFLVKLSELLQENFTLSESIDFMKYMMPKRKNAMNYLLNQLKNGYRLDETLLKLGYSDQIVSQIYLGNQNGQFKQALLNSGTFLEVYAKEQKKIKQLLIYPMILVSFVLLLLLGIRQFFLPQLKNIIQNNEANNLIKSTIFLIENFPIILFGIVTIIFFCLGILKIIYQKKNALDRIRLLCKIPLLKKWIKLYYSYYFSRELSCFYNSGYTIKQIVHTILEGNTSKILKEFANIVESYSVLGMDLPTIISKFSFLKEEMSHIISYGEKISQIALKLNFYAQECFEILQKDIEKKMIYIQPIIFLCIGIIILLVYITLMLPVLTMVDNLFM